MLDQSLQTTDRPIDLAPLGARIATVLAITIPLLGVCSVPFLVWGWGFGWVDLGILIGMYLLTTLGVTVGFHRLFVHRSFETYGWMKIILVLLGSMAVQGSLLRWVGLHRLHHQHSDRVDDPHSPHRHGASAVGVLKGFWHAHLGWFFEATPDLSRYVKDVEAVPGLRRMSDWFPLWIVLGLIIPAVLGGVLTQSWSGVVTAVIWGGLVRAFLVHHVTWSINSACHLWGTRPFRSTDMSRNNALFGVLALGEGWHNAHHAFPNSARHGLRWWELDLSYLVIRCYALLGLAWGIKLPTAQAISQQRSS